MLAFFFLVRSYIFFDDDIGKQLSLKSKTDESEYTHSLMLRNNYKNKFEIECLCVCVCGVLHVYMSIHGWVSLEPSEKILKKALLCLFFFSFSLNFLFFI